MAQILENPVETEKPSDHKGVWHVVCCKPVVPKGLCGLGKWQGRVQRNSPWSASHCIVCKELWEAHQHTCPRDSGFW